MKGFQAKAVARKLMRENAPKVFFVGIVFIIITTVMSELEFRLPGISEAYQRALDQMLQGELPRIRLLYINFRPTGALLAFLLYLLYPVIETGMMSYCIKMTGDATGDYKDLLDGFLFFGKVMLIFIVTTVLTALWAMLFFFPGIVAHYRYRQAYYILLETPDKGAMQCIRESKLLMRGNKLDLFLLDLSFLGWYILDLLVVILIPSPVPLPIISIWLTPYMGLSRAAYYRHIVSKLTV